MSIHIACGGTAVSAGLVAAGQSPEASRQASAAACRRPVKAVSTHYMALGRAATRQPHARLGVDSSGSRPMGRTARHPRRRRSLAAGGRSHVGPPPSGRLEQVFSLRCWYGSRTRRQPDSLVWCSTTELTWLTRPSVRTHVRNTRRQPPRERTGRRAPLARPYHCFQRGAGGSRTHLKLLCRQLPCRLAPAPRHSVSSPGVEPGLRPSQGRVLIRHTPRTFLSAPRRGIEPRLADS